jgi:hypothetical protein
MFSARRTAAMWDRLSRLTKRKKHKGAGEIEIDIFEGGACVVTQAGGCLDESSEDKSETEPPAEML